MHRVFLIGYRGCGKTTVGRLLAERLSWGAIDSDDEVERRAGRSIASLFAEAGEEAFRDLEEGVVAELCGRDGVVVSLGGGAILREPTRARIAAAGPVVWLTARAETLARRVAADPTSVTRRPSLTGMTGLAEVERVLALREPIYRGCATLEIDSEAGSPAAVAARLAALLGAP